jgi:glycosyltransferase involved in cell wall biosynthesis
VEGITIVICCYNSARRLPATLASLALQEGLEAVPWEVVVVNNNSSDNTEQVARQEWNEKDVDVPLRVVNEPKPGLSHARSRGVAEAKYDYLVFCDDDNSLFPDYLRRTWYLFQHYTKIGLIGGVGIPVFEGEKPEWFDGVRIKYAVGPQNQYTGDISKTGKALYGAGMAVRKAVFERLEERGFRFVLSDRKGGALSSGGDTELCFAAVILGYKMVYDEGLRFYHHIGADRLTGHYLELLSAGMLRSTVLIRPYIYHALDTKESRIRHLWLYEITKTLYEYLLAVKTHKWRGACTLPQYLKKVGFLLKLNTRYDQLSYSIKRTLKTTTLG